MTIDVGDDSSITDAGGFILRPESAPFDRAASPICAGGGLAAEDFDANENLVDLVVNAQDGKERSIGALVL